MRHRPRCGDRGRADYLLFRAPNLPNGWLPKLKCFEARPDLAGHAVVDRTRSPAAVSQKREYFKYPPETIGYFAPEVAEFGVWRPTVNSQSPPLAGISGIAEGKISRSLSE